MASITLNHVSHYYGDSPANDESYALKTMNQTWEDGGAFALLGPSGCGKTTLLNIISGLLLPKQGQVIFDNQDVTALPVEKRHVAQVFQFPVIYETMTVFDNLAFPLKNQGYAKSEIKKQVQWVAEALDLTSDLSCKAHQLGAELKQLVSMGRGLVRKDVKAMLFDEPLTTIDPTVKWQLRQKLKAIQQAFNMTMIYVTHDQHEAATFADKVAVMHGGRILQFDAPEDLFEKPQHQFVGHFIGSPGMNFLPCQIKSGYAQTHGLAIPLPAAFEQVGSSSENEYSLGIRPEYVEVTTDAQQNAFTAKVIEQENHGHYRLLSLQCGKGLVHAKVPEQQVVKSESVWVRFPQAKLRLYQNQMLVE